MRPLMKLRRTCPASLRGWTFSAASMTKSPATRSVRHGTKSTRAKERMRRLLQLGRLHDLGSGARRVAVNSRVNRKRTDVQVIAVSIKRDLKHRQSQRIATSIEG